MKKKLFSKLAATALAAAMVIGTATTSLSTYAAGLNQVTGLSVVERDEDELTLKWKKVAGADMPFHVRGKGRFKTYGGKRISKAGKRRIPGNRAYRK